jgi:hypothetical protein
MVRMAEMRSVKPEAETVEPAAAVFFAPPLAAPASPQPTLDMPAAQSQRITLAGEPSRSNRKKGSDPFFQRRRCEASPSEGGV